MLLANFDPPANSTDFDSIPNQRSAWSDTLSFWFTGEVRGVEQSVGAGHSQFYNPHTTDTPNPSTTAAISWIGFPKLVTSRHPGNHQAALQEADALLERQRRPIPPAGRVLRVVRHEGRRVEQDRTSRFHVRRT